MGSDKTLAADRCRHSGFGGRRRRGRRCIGRRDRQSAGTLYGTLPAGCSYEAVNAQPYYRCTDGLWFVPAYGANGVYYRVVMAP